MVKKSFEKIFPENYISTSWTSSHSINKVILTYLEYGKYSCEIKTTEYDSDIYKLIRLKNLKEIYNNNMSNIICKFLTVTFRSADDKLFTTFVRELDCEEVIPKIDSGMFCEVADSFRDIGVVVNDRVIYRHYGWETLEEAKRHIAAIWHPNVGGFDNCNYDSNYLLWRRIE